MAISLFKTPTIADADVPAAIARDAEVTAAIAAIGASYKRKAGVWFAADGRGDNVNHNPAVNTLIAYPIRVDTAQPIDRVLLGVTTGVASALMRVGLYDTAASGDPSTLLTDFGGTFDGASTSDAVTRSVALTMPSGKLWVAYVQQGAVATWRGHSLLDWQATQANTSPLVDGARVSRGSGTQSGALPSTWPGFDTGAFAVDATVLRVTFRAA